MTSRKTQRVSRKPGNTDTPSHDLSLAFPTTPTVPRVIGRAVSGSGSALLARRKSLASIDLSSSRSWDGQDDILSTSKICKKLVVHAKQSLAESDSIQVDLYIKIAIPASVATQSVRLFETGLAKLQKVQVAAYTDGIPPNVSSEVVTAASALGIGLASPFTLEARPTSQPSLDVIQKEDGIYATVMVSTHTSSREEGYTRMCDYVVAVSLEMPLTSGSPEEAYITDIPIPTCLQNALHVSLPQVKETDIDYVMSTQPALRPFAKSRSSGSKLDKSTSSIDQEELFQDPNYVKISGTFPSTSLLTLRWADRAKVTGFEGDFVSTLTLERNEESKDHYKGSIVIEWRPLSYVTVQPVSHITLELHSGDFDIGEMDIASKAGEGGAVVIDSKEIDIFRASGDGSEDTRGTFSRNHSSSIEELRSVLSRTKSSPTKGSSSQSILDTAPPFANQTAEITIDDIQPPPTDEPQTPKLYSPSLDETAHDLNVKKLRKFSIALDSRYIAKGGAFVLSFEGTLPSGRGRVPHVSITPSASLSMIMDAHIPSFTFSSQDGTAARDAKEYYDADRPLFVKVMSAQDQTGYFGSQEEHTPYSEEPVADTQSSYDQGEKTQLVEQTPSLKELPASSSSSLIVTEEADPLMMDMLVVVTPSFATSTVHTGLRAGIPLSLNSLEVKIPMHGDSDNSVFDAFLGFYHIPCTPLGPVRSGGQDMLSFKLDIADARKRSAMDGDEIAILYTTGAARGADEVHSPLIWSMPSFSCDVSNITIHTNSEVPHTSTSEGFDSDIAVKGKACRKLKLATWPASSPGRWPIICFANPPINVPRHLAVAKEADTEQVLRHMPSLRDIPASIFGTVLSEKSEPFILDVRIVIMPDFASSTVHTSIRAQIPPSIATLGLVVPSDCSSRNVGLEAFLGSRLLTTRATNSSEISGRNMLSYEIDLLSAQEQTSTEPYEFVVTYISSVPQPDGEAYGILLWNLPLFSCGVANITVRTAASVPHTTTSAGFLINVPIRGKSSRLLKAPRWQASTSGCWPTICFQAESTEPPKSVITDQVSRNQPSFFRTYLWYLSFLILAITAAVHLFPEIRLMHRKLDRLGMMLQEQEQVRLDTLQSSSSLQSIPTSTVTETVYLHITETRTRTIAVTTTSLPASVPTPTHYAEQGTSSTGSFPSPNSLRVDSLQESLQTSQSLGDPVLSLESILRRTFFALELHSERIYIEGRKWFVDSVRRLIA